MSVFNNPNFISFSGEPITGRVPTKTVVYGPQMTGPQQAGVAHAYKLFCDAVNTSVGKYVVQNRVLADGTKVRMISNWGNDTVMVWTTGEGGEDLFGSGIGIILKDTSNATIRVPAVGGGFRDLGPLILTPAIDRKTNRTNGKWKAREVPSLVGGNALWVDSKRKNWLSYFAPKKNGVPYNFLSRLIYSRAHGKVTPVEGDNFAATGSQYLMAENRTVALRAQEGTFNGACITLAEGKPFLCTANIVVTDGEYFVEVRRSPLSRSRGLEKATDLRKHIGDGVEDDDPPTKYTVPIPIYPSDAPTLFSPDGSVALFVAMFPNSSDEGPDYARVTLDFPVDGEPTLTTAEFAYTPNTLIEGGSFQYQNTYSTVHPDAYWVNDYISTGGQSNSNLWHFGGEVEEYLGATFVPATGQFEPVVLSARAEYTVSLSSQSQYHDSTSTTGVLGEVGFHTETFTGSLSSTSNGTATWSAAHKHPIGGDILISQGSATYTRSFNSIKDRGSRQYTITPAPGVPTLISSYANDAGSETHSMTVSSVARSVLLRHVENGMDWAVCMKETFIGSSSWVNTSPSAGAPDFWRYGDALPESPRPTIKASYSAEILKNGVSVWEEHLYDLHWPPDTSGLYYLVNPARVMDRVVQQSDAAPGVQSQSGTYKFSDKLAGQLVLGRTYVTALLGGAAWVGDIRANSLFIDSAVDPVTGALVVSLHTGSDVMQGGDLTKPAKAWVFLLDHAGFTPIQKVVTPTKDLIVVADRDQPLNSLVSI